MRKGKVYVMGVDQMVLPLTKQMIREGCVPTLAKLMERGSVYQALASYPCYTPNNWQSILMAMPAPSLAAARTRSPRPRPT